MCNSTFPSLRNLLILSLNDDVFFVQRTTALFKGLFQRNCAYCVGTHVPVLDFRQVDRCESSTVYFSEIGLGQFFIDTNIVKHEAVIMRVVCFL